MNKKVFLEGEELAAYQEEKKIEAAAKAKAKALSDRTRRLKEAADLAADAVSSGDSSSSASEAEEEDEAGLEAGMDDAMRDITRPSKRVLATIDAEGGAADEGLVTGIYDEFIGDQDRLGSFDIYTRGQPRPEFTLPVKKDDEEEYYPPLREQTRLRMFPFVEKRRKVDAYGEVVDVSAWLSRGKSEADIVEGAKDVLGKRKRDEEHAAKVGRVKYNRLIADSSLVWSHRKKLKHLTNSSARLSASRCPVLSLSWTWKARRTGELSRRSCLI